MLRTYRFLVVDDDRATREVIARLLARTYDAHVDQASSTDEGLEAASGTPPPDLVITDLCRGEPDAFRLIEEIRQSGRLRRVPVLVQSGQALRLELDSWRAGASAILQKPYTAEALLGTIDRILHTGGNPIASLIELGTESPALDYKETLSTSGRLERAGLAKDVIAFANYGGGQIVVGVAEVSPGVFVPRGIRAEHRAALEVTRLNQALRRFLDPAISVGVRVVAHEGREFGVLDIPGAVGTLVLARVSNEAAGLYTGRIYSRTPAAESAEVQSSSEVRALIERLATSRLTAARPATGARG